MHKKIHIDATTLFVAVLFSVTLGILALMVFDKSREDRGSQHAGVVPVKKEIPAEKNPRTKKSGDAKNTPPVYAPKMGVLSEHEFRSVFTKSNWPPEMYQAVRQIAYCESRLIPNAKGPTDDHGLMQVRFAEHHGKVSILRALYDPLTNLNVAYAVFLEAKRGTFRHGFAPWYSSNRCHGLVPTHVARNIQLRRSEASS